MLRHYYISRQPPGNLNITGMLDLYGSEKMVRLSVKFPAPFLCTCNQMEKVSSLEAYCKKTNAYFDLGSSTLGWKYTQFHDPITKIKYFVS